MGRLFQPLLFFLACCTEGQLRRQIEFLKAENQMLRTHVPKQRISLSKKERERLLQLGNGAGLRSYWCRRSLPPVLPRVWHHLSSSGAT